MKKSLTFLIVLFTSLNTSHQYSAQTCPPPEDVSSRTINLYEKATEKKKKRTTEERIDMLKEVVDQQDDWTKFYRKVFGAYNFVSSSVFSASEAVDSDFSSTDGASSAIDF